jgi:hypothetical protein
MTVVTNLSSELMELVNINHEMDWRDFDDVVEFLEKNLDAVIKEVHGFDKLIIDDGKVMLNVPPSPEAGDSHGGELLRTLSEKQGSGGITLKREFKVHLLGPDPDDATKRRIEIREDVVRAPDEAGQPPIYAEHSVVITI